jgi:hypothetical protein
MNKYLIPGLTASTMILAVAFAYSMGAQAQSSTAYIPQYESTRAVEEWNVAQMGNRADDRGQSSQGYTSDDKGQMDAEDRGMHTQLDLTNLDLSDSDVDLEEMEAMLTVLINDEYKARAEYEALVDEFGDQNPFTSLIKAETNHSNALAGLFDAFDLDVPEDNGADYAVVPDSLQEAYEIGIQAEIDNIALYEDYLKLDLPDAVEQVFENLMTASEHHLATFEAYASGDPIVNESNAYGSSGQGGRGRSNH